MISLSDEHPLNAEDPIKVTEEGIVISVSEEHFSNAEGCIIFINEGMIICSLQFFAHISVSKISVFASDL